MSSGDYPRLDEHEQQRFKEMVLSRLKELNLSQADVAQSMPEVEGADGSVNQILKDRFRSYISRFISGDPKIVPRWMVTERDKLLVPFAAALKWSPDDVLELMAKASHGEVLEAVQIWHPAFGTLTTDDVAVMARLSKWSHYRREAILEKVRSCLFAPGTKEPVWLWVKGELGTGRHTMARLLEKRLRKEEEKRREEEGAQDNPSDSEVKPVKIQLLLEEPEDGWSSVEPCIEGPVIAVTKRIPQGEDTPSGFKVEDTAVLPWGQEEVAALSRRLHKLGALDGSQLRHCLEMARQMEQTPWLLGPDRGPMAVKATLASVKRRGTPASPSELRDWKLDDVWKQAVARAEPLGLLGQQFMEQFWSGCVLSLERPLEFTLTEQGALERLADALHGTRRKLSVAQSWKQPLQRLREARKAAEREKEAKNLEAALLRDEPAVVLEALVDAGLLVQRSEHLKAADVEQARVWAARGLAVRGTLGLVHRPELLVEPGWRELAVEIAIAGFSPEKLERELAQVPPWGMVEVAHTWVLFAAPLPRNDLDLMEGEALHKAWHGSLWAWVHGAPEAARNFRYPYRHVFDDNILEVALRSLSRRLTGELPDFESDNPITELEHRVPAGIRKLTEPCRLAHERDIKKRTREADDQEEAPEQCHLRYPSTLVVAAAQGQWLPWTMFRYVQLERRQIKNIWKLLDRRARNGDDRAVSLLAGRKISFGRNGYLVGDEGILWSKVIPWEYSLHWTSRGNRLDKITFWRLWHVVHGLGWPGDKEARPFTWCPESSVVDKVADALGRFPSEMVQELLNRSLSVGNQLRTMSVAEKHQAPLKALDRIDLSKPLVEGGKPIPQERQVEILNNNPPITEQEMMELDWFSPKEVAPTFAMALTVRLGLAEPLREAVNSFENWRSQLRAGLVGSEVVLRDPSGVGCPQMAFCLDPRWTKDSWGILELLDDFSERAALELWRMGDKEHLRARWNHGKVADVPPGIASDLQWIDLVYGAREASVETLEDANPPLELIRQRLKLKEDDPLAFFSSVNQRLRYQEQVTSFGAGIIGSPPEHVRENWHRRDMILRRLRAIKPWDNKGVSDAIRKAWLGVWHGSGPRVKVTGRHDPASRSITPQELQLEIDLTMDLALNLETHSQNTKLSDDGWLASLFVEQLLNQCLDTPEPDVLSWLSRATAEPVGFMDALLRRRASGPPSQLRTDATDRAGRLLLDEGDDTPVRDWLGALMAIVGKDFHLPSRLNLVDKQIVEKPRLLDRAWALCEDDNCRRELLLRTHHRLGGDPANLRGWMFLQAGSNETPDSIRFFFLRHVYPDPRAEELLITMFKKAEHPRVRAYFGYRLHYIHSDDPQVIASMMEWLEKDPEPLSGGPTFKLTSHDPWRPFENLDAPLVVEGGALHLLKFLLTWPALLQHKSRVLPQVRNMFWRIAELFADDRFRRSHIDPFCEPPNPDETNEPQDVQRTLAALLEALDDRQTLRSIFSDDFCTSPLEFTGAKEERAELVNRRTAFFRSLFSPWYMRICSAQKKRELFCHLGGDEAWYEARKALSDRQYLNLLKLNNNETIKLESARALLGRSSGPTDRRTQVVARLALKQWPLEYQLSWTGGDFNTPFNPWVDLLWLADPERCLSHTKRYLEAFPDEKEQVIEALTSLAQEGGPGSAQTRVMVRRLLLDA